MKNHVILETTSLVTRSLTCFCDVQNCKGEKKWVLWVRGWKSWAERHCAQEHNAELSYSSFRCSNPDFSIQPSTLTIRPLKTKRPTSIIWHFYLWCQITVPVDYRFCTLSCPMWTFSSAFFKTDKLYTPPARYRNLALPQELCVTWDSLRSLSLQTVNWGKSKSSSGDPWQGFNASWLGCYQDIAPVITGRR